ncbi:HEAT repeat domain-containing protein [Azospirillum sp. TSO22-1]|uniref:HEAT repeat domain-containing protein n=1 Tax=Azospirillum sp. TSO22-1 TaxID=716789 RepID=UPI000D64D8A4|nr:HEAT repeat domain-containing protein [Azospirillum sp. TSO22-1]
MNNKVHLIAAVAAALLVAITVLDVGKGALEGGMAVVEFLRDSSIIDLSGTPGGNTIVLVAIVLFIAIMAIILVRLVKGSGKDNELPSGRADAAGDMTDVRRRYLQHMKREVENRLNASIHHALLLSLNMDERSDVTNPWHYPESMSGSGHAFSTFQEAYEHFDRRLLLFGAPGSGKSTTLLIFARDLIARALADDSAPVPILESLSRFQSVLIQEKAGRFHTNRAPKENRGKLQQDETPKEDPATDLTIQNRIAFLVGSLRVPALSPAVVDSWIERGSVVLLLDGLDEISDRFLPMFAEYLNNTLLARHSQLPTVVASRLIEYQPLEHGNDTKLRLTGAVTLQPLRDEQVTAYLVKAGADALSEGLADDKALTELARNPLTLSMMALAYRGMERSEIGKELPLHERRLSLFDNFIDRMMQREAFRKANRHWNPNSRETLATHYSRDEVNHYLANLAIALSERAQVRFSGRKIGGFFLTPKHTSSSAPNEIFLPAALLLATALGVAASGIQAIAGGLDGSILYPPPIAVLCALSIYAADEDNLPWLPPWASQTALYAIRGALIIGALAVIGTVGNAAARLFGSPSDVAALSALATASLLTMAFMPKDMPNDVPRRLRRMYAVARWIRCVALPVVGASVAAALFPDHGWLAAAAAGCLITLAQVALEAPDERLIAGLVCSAAFGLGAFIGWLMDWYFGPFPPLYDTAMLAMLLGALAIIGDVGLFAAGAAVAVATLTASAAAAMAAAWVVLLFVLSVRRNSTHSKQASLNTAAKLWLKIRRTIPWQTQLFFDYSCHTLLLRKIEDDYEFIHIILRNHFAVRELTATLSTSHGSERINIMQKLALQGVASFDTIVELTRNEDPKLRAQAVSLLVKIPSPDRPKMLLHVLRSEPDSKIRILIADAFDRLEYKERHKLSMEFLNDNAAKIRAAGLIQLNKIGMYCGDEIIIRLFEDSDDYLFDIALTHFANARFGNTLFAPQKDISTPIKEKFGRKIFAAINRMINSKEIDDKLSAIKIANDLFPERLPDLLEICFRDTAEKVRRATTYAYINISPDISVPAVIQACNDTNAHVRMAAVSTMQSIIKKLILKTHNHDSDHQALTRALQTSLTERLKDQDPMVRADALKSLQHLPDIDQNAVLCDALSDADQRVRASALEEVGTRSLHVFFQKAYELMGDKHCWKQAADAVAATVTPDKIDGLIEALKTTRSRWRQCALAHALGQLKAEQAVPTLERLTMRQCRWRRLLLFLALGADAVGNNATDTRLQLYMEALSKIGKESSFATFATLLKHPSASVRGTAVKALENFKHERAGELLEDATRDEDDGVSRSARLALQTFNMTAKR